MMSQVLFAGRLARLVAHLLQGLLTCALVFPFIGQDRRAGHIQRWSASLLRICRVQLQVGSGAAISPSRALVVANHISWLDIFVMNAAQPNQFVAKAEIRQWPLIGWLCAQTGTVFIARGKLREVRRIYTGLVERLELGHRVAFFPEGSTAGQGSLQAFHSNLFEAAVEAQADVLPCAIRYMTEAGQYHPAVNYVDPITFVQSVFMILKADVIRAELSELEPIKIGPDTERRALAQAAHAAIEQALTTTTFFISGTPDAARERQY